MSDNQNLVVLVSFVLITLLVGGLSYWQTRSIKQNSTKGFFLAGRGLSAWFIAGSMLMTNLSAEQLVGLNGNAYAFDISGMAWESTAAIPIIALALFFLPRYLRSGFTTLPQYLELRYDQNTRRIVSSMFIIGYTLVANPTALYLGSITIEEMFTVHKLIGVGYETSIYIICISMGAIGAIYSIFGGMRAAAVSDGINGIILLIAAILVPVLGLYALGNGSISSGMSELVGNHPEKLNAIGSSTSSVPFSTIFTGMVCANLFYWCTNQMIIQRSLAARNLAEGQKGVLFAGCMKLLVPTMMVFPGLIAFHIFGPNLQSADLAYPTLVHHVLPWWLVGFFVAALFGTVVSHFNSVVNSTATLFSLDLYRPMAPHRSDEHIVVVGKWASLILSCISLLIAPLLMYATDGIYMLIRLFTGFYSIPIISIVLVGFFTRNVNAHAAKTVLILHMVVYAVLNFGYPVKEKLGLHFIHLMGILFVCEVSLMLIWGKISATNVAKTTLVSLNDDGDAPVDLTPWRYAKSLSIGIVAFLITTYLTFSPLGVAQNGGPGNVYFILLGVIWMSACLAIYIERNHYKKNRNNKVVVNISS